ncbi:hypothetical protein D3C86_966200 [compost metagenome]
MNFSLVCLCQSLDCANIPGDGIAILLCEAEQSHRKITPYWYFADQVGSNGFNYVQSGSKLHFRSVPMICLCH